MDFMSFVALVIFAGFAVRTVYLLLREESQKDLLLTTGLWGLALLAWALYLGTDRGWKPAVLAVVALSITTFGLSFYGLLKLREERPEEFEKEL